MSATPTRIRLERRAGFNLQEASRKLNGLPAVNCARPGRWGNPFKVNGYAEQPTARGSHYRFIRDNASAVRWFERMLRQGVTPPFALANIREELRGKNLACYCKPNQKCHADVLLEIANA